MATNPTQEESVINSNGKTRSKDQPTGVLSELVGFNLLSLRTEVSRCNWAAPSASAALQSVCTVFAVSRLPGCDLLILSLGRHGPRKIRMTMTCETSQDWVSIILNVSHLLLFALTICLRVHLQLWKAIVTNSFHTGGPPHRANELVAPPIPQVLGSGVRKDVKLISSQLKGGK